jgi:hypothetical protein
LQNRRNNFGEFCRRKKYKNANLFMLRPIASTSARRASNALWVLIQLCYPEYLVKATTSHFKTPAEAGGNYIIG